MTTQRKKNAKGNAIIAVTALGMFIMLLAAAIVNSQVSSEASAVEDSLAKLRIYWAAQGHMNYALSRLANSGACPSAPTGPCVEEDENDSIEPTPNDGTGLPLALAAVPDPPISRADALRKYLLELSDDNNNATRNWDYTEYNSGTYQITLQHKVEDIGTVNDGLLRVTLAPTGVGAFDALQGLALINNADSRVRALQFGLCIGEATCPIATFNVESGQNKITFLRRCKPDNLTISTDSPTCPEHNTE